MFPIVRLIQYSSEDGSMEGVYFTEDIAIDAFSVCPKGCTVDEDVVMDGYDFPSSFPLDKNLTRA